MTELANEKPRRKVLRLKMTKEPKVDREHEPSKYVNRPEAIYMVYGEGCDMPKRVYRTDEARIACTHAAQLAIETGKRFYVMRAWRGFDPVVAHD